MKTCTKCLRGKPLSEFPTSGDPSGRLKAQCKGCTAIDRKALRAKARGEDVEVVYPTEDKDRYRYVVEEYARVLAPDAPQASCAGKADMFELAGKTPAEVRQAVAMCASCPFALMCAEGAEGTMDMIRAGQVYTNTGVAYDPERYIARHMGGGLRNMMKAQVKEHAARNSDLPTEERDPMCPLGKGNITGYGIGCRCQPCTLANRSKEARKREREMAWSA